MPAPTRLQEPVLAHARKDFALLRESMTIDEALGVIREQGVGERIVYFYVADEEKKLTGVLPTRRLLAAQGSTPIRDVMIRRVVAIPATATLLDACELFVLYKFFAIPVIDDERHLVGVIDIGVFTEEVLDLAEPEKVNDMFETLGFHLTQMQGASPFRAFRLRFPWLLATIASGTAGAMLAGLFEATLARALIVSFFLALVLALAESVSIQSMTLTLQALRASKPTWRWFVEKARREILTAAFLGIACGALVFCIAWVWRGSAAGAAVVGGTVLGSIGIACFAGLLIPSLLHALRLDPKIAAGPLTLATTDILTLTLYFSLATWLL
jgi:magnesium transporter